MSEVRGTFELALPQAGVISHTHAHARRWPCAARQTTDALAQSLSWRLLWSRDAPLPQHNQMKETRRYCSPAGRAKHVAFRPAACSGFGVWGSCSQLPGFGGCPDGYICGRLLRLLQRGEFLIATFSRSTFPHTHTGSSACSASCATRPEHRLPRHHRCASLRRIGALFAHCSPFTMQRAAWISPKVSARPAEPMEACMPEWPHAQRWLPPLAAGCCQLRICCHCALGPDRVAAPARQPALGNLDPLRCDVARDGRS